MKRRHSTGNLCDESFVQQDLSSTPDPELVVIAVQSLPCALNNNILTGRIFRASIAIPFPVPVAVATLVPAK